MRPKRPCCQRRWGSAKSTKRLTAPSNKWIHKYTKKKKREKIEQHKRFRYHLDCLSIQVTGLLVRKLFHLTFAIIYDPIGSKRKKLKKSKTASSIFSRVARPCLIERASFLRVEKSHQRIPPQKKRHVRPSFIFLRYEAAMSTIFFFAIDPKSIQRYKQAAASCVFGSRVFQVPDFFFVFLLLCGLIDS